MKSKKEVLKSKQPYRVWYEYLQTCLNDKKLSKMVDREFYRSWNLSSVKNDRFDTWFKTHSHLFEDKETIIQLYDGKKKSDTVLVEIPTNYTVRKVNEEIGKVLKGKLNQSNAKFSITSNRSLQIDKLDYFLWCYQWRQMTKYSSYGGLELIWQKLNKRVNDRQHRYRKDLSKGADAKIKRRIVSRYDAYSTTDNKSKAVMISRNIKLAKRILENTCKGEFVGDYSDH